jgi:hypothetical protein
VKKIGLRCEPNRRVHKFSERQKIMLDHDLRQIRKIRQAKRGSLLNHSPLIQSTPHSGSFTQKYITCADI